jgi:hypothetical protein
MWLIQQGDRLEVRANAPDHNLQDVLRAEFPDARILRSKKRIINDVNALVFAVVYLPGELVEVEVPVLDEAGRPVLDDDGNPVVEKQETIGPGVARPIGNTQALEGDELVVRSPAGDELGRWPFEVV